MAAGLALLGRGQCPGSSEPWAGSAAAPEHPDAWWPESGQPWVAGGVWSLGNGKDWKGPRRRAEEEDQRSCQRVGTRSLSLVSAQTRGQGVLVEVAQGMGWAHRRLPNLPHRLANTCNPTIKDLGFGLSSIEWKHFMCY